MIALLSDLARIAHVARKTLNPARGLRPWASVLAAAALLAGCGGGVSGGGDFTPTRLVVLGDEASYLDDSDGAHNARKYSVNGLDSSGNRSCAVLPLAAQSVASRYGLVFAGCNSAGASVGALNRAQPGAQVDSSSTGLAAQVAAQQAAGGFGDQTLALLWIGSNDIVSLYQQVNRGTLGWDAALAEARSRGTAAAAQVRVILASGARMLVFTAPDMGLSPYARALESAADPDDSSVVADSQARERLTALTEAYNGNLRTSINPGSSYEYDGHNFGLVFPDEVVQAFDETPDGYTGYLISPYNVSDAACSEALPNCDHSADTLTYGHVWASSRWLGYPAHAMIANQAQDRLDTLPF